MTVQTAMSPTVHGPGESKPGPARRNETDKGFESALRSKSEDQAGQMRDTEPQNSKTDLSRLDFNAAQNRKSKAGISEDLQQTGADAEVDALETDRQDPAESSGRNDVPGDQSPRSTVESWMNRLHALDGRARAEPAETVPPQAEVETPPVEQKQLPLLGNTQTHIAETQNPGKPADAVLAMQPVLPDKPVSRNLRPVADNSTSPDLMLKGKIGIGDQKVVDAGASAQTPAERITGTQKMFEAAEPRTAQAVSPLDRSDASAGTDAAGKVSLQTSPANASSVQPSTLQAGSPLPTPPVLQPNISPANANLAPATSSVLSQMEQVETVRELASTDRIGFVSRLTQNGSSVQVLRLQLKPAELGTVTAHMRMENGQMTVELVAEKDAAFRQLSRDISVMQSAMRSMGIVVDEIVVSQGNASSEVDQTVQDQNRSSAEGRSESDSQQRAGQQSNDGDTAHESGWKNAEDGEKATSSDIYI